MSDRDAIADIVLGVIPIPARSGDKVTVVIGGIEQTFLAGEDLLEWYIVEVGPDGLVRPAREWSMSP